MNIIGKIMNSEKGTKNAKNGHCDLWNLLGFIFDP
jgi:hypothetical protein